jgi:hypothetical protein
MYCWVYFYIQILNITYRGVDGLGIALIRFLYIKKGNWLKYKFGEQSFLIWVEITIWVVCLIMVYFFGSENISNRTIYNTCMGHNEAFEVIR